MQYKIINYSLLKVLDITIYYYTSCKFLYVIFATVIFWHITWTIIDTQYNNDINVVLSR